MFHPRIRYIVFFLVLIFTAASIVHCRESLTSLWDSARRGGTYTTVSVEELITAERLFAQLYKEGYSQDIADAWDRLGFNLTKETYPEKHILILKEKPTQKRGRGFYLFNTESSNNHLLMIPHGFKDEGTGRIGLDMFLENDFGALALNTFPRFTINDDGNKQVQDFGKLTDSYFVALTKAFSMVTTTDNIYQLHGFAVEKRKTVAGKNAGMILSGGTKKVRPDIRTLQPCLQNLLAEKVYIYPTDVTELGGTTNITGKILRKSHNDGFFHIEINRQIRDRLKADRSFRQTMSRCLEES